VKSIDLGVLNLASLSEQNERISPRARRSPRRPGRLDDRLDLFAQSALGSEDRCVADLGMHEQHALDLGRVDVRPARDDHVGLAVAEEEEAVSSKKPMSPT